MVSDPVVERCLGSIRARSRALADEVAGLPDAVLDGPTNCPPWQVRDLIAHVITSGEGFRASIERGLAGSTEPAVAPEQRARREAQLAAAGRTVLVAALDQVTNDFEAQYAGLDDTGLGTICYHRRGNRSVRWYAAHRLAEVAFHAWDLDRSLGRDATLDEEIAAQILPTLLESNAPRTYAAGLSAERGNGERYMVTVAGEPSARWLIAIHPDRLDVVRGDGATDATIAGSAATLALLVYGRATLHDLVRTGVLRADGDRAVVDRFPAVFPRP